MYTTAARHLHLGISVIACMLMVDSASALEQSHDHLIDVYLQYGVGVLDDASRLEIRSQHDAGVHVQLHPTPGIAIGVEAMQSFATIGFQGWAQSATFITITPSISFIARNKDIPALALEFNAGYTLREYRFTEQYILTLDDIVQLAFAVRYEPNDWWRVRVSGGILRGAWGATACLGVAL